MRTLFSKNLTQFIGASLVVLLITSPLFFFIMKIFYTQDLDELILYRTEKFIEQRLPHFKEADIYSWNENNEYSQIITYDESLPLNKITEEEQYAPYEGHTIDFRVHYRPILVEDKPYVFVSKVAMIENHDLIGTIIVQQLVLALFLLTTLTVVQQRLTRKLWNPFYHTLKRIKEFSLEDEEEVALPQTKIKEFTQLNENVSQLLTRNIKIYKEQKEFIENASHELQTPLAVFQSQLDLFLQLPNLSEEQLILIDSLYSTASRLRRLNKDLLFLAKIDNEQFTDTEQLQVDELVTKQLDLLTPLIQGNNIEVSASIKRCSLKANLILTESLISNLLINAIKHNYTGGTIQVTLKERQLTVVNTSEVPPVAMDKIAKRFYRSGTTASGSGLGFPIMLKICKLHHWKLNYNFTAGRHNFSISFSE